MYLIVGGQVSICDLNGALLSELAPGEFFGDESLFSEKKRSYIATSKTKVELLSLTRSHLLSIIQECPSVALAFLESYTLQLNFRAR
jgi:CRP-like cAMP-binding protein